MKPFVRIFILVVALAFPRIANAQVDWKFDYDTPQEYIDSFNVNINKSLSERIMMTYEAPSEGVECIEAVDSLDRTLYMYNKICVDNWKTFNRASMIIDAGIEKFPKRLDMRMGAAYAAMLAPVPDRVEIALCEALEYGYENGHNWLWDNDESVDDGENVLLDAVCDYVYQMYGRDEFKYAIRNVSMTVLEHKPKYVPSLNVMAVLELDRDTRKALELFKSVNEIDPTDVLVMANIARCHFLLEEYKDAAKWYEKILKIKDIDDDFRTAITEKLKEIKNK